VGATAPTGAPDVTRRISPAISTPVLTHDAFVNVLETIRGLNRSVAVCLITMGPGMTEIPHMASATYWPLCARGPSRPRRLPNAIRPADRYRCMGADRVSMSGRLEACLDWRRERCWACARHHIVKFGPKM
jgi:hypothetical protein